MAKRGYLPETSEEISADWLSRALKTEINTVSLIELGEDLGFMGEVLKLEIESPDAKLPRYLVAKLPKKANRVIGELLGVYEREILFFRSFAAHLPVRAPRLYFSDFDRDRGSEKQREIIRWLDGLPKFMTGLIGWLAYFIARAKKRRYLLLIEFFDTMTPGDQLAGLNAEGCRCVLGSIAAMHRKYWDAAELQNHFWLMEMDIDARMRHGTFLAHVDRYACALDDHVRPHLNWLREHGELLVRRFHGDTPSTLLHCDLRLDNVLFEGKECAFIDFQLVRSGPAAYDVAYFLSSALAETASATDRENLLRHYHAALAVPDYSYSQLRRDYERALLVILSTLSSNDDVELGDSRGQQMMSHWLRRLSACLEDVDLEALSELVLSPGEGSTE